MAADQVLVTGADGYIGFAIVCYLLSSGKQVRATVRTQQKVDPILENPHVKPHASRLEVALLPDLDSSALWKPVLDGVTHIIHPASPSTHLSQSDDPLKTHVNPSVAAVVTLLETLHADDTSTVRRIVVTGTLVAISKQFTNIGEPEPVETEYYAASARVTPTPLAPPNGHPAQLYAICKIAELNESEAWMAKNKPKFDLVHLNVGQNSGGDKRAKVRGDLFKSTCFMTLGGALGKSADGWKEVIPWPFLPGAYVHIDDTAKVHAEVLDESLIAHDAGTSRAFSVACQSAPVPWDTIHEAIDKRFAKEIEQGLLPNKGRPLGSKGYGYYIEETGKALGWTPKSFDLIVGDTIASWLALPDEKAITAST